MTVSTSVPAIYGPVQSWRFGKSLGIDMIGPISACSFNCLYCQLGGIEQIICDRGLFVSTTDLHDELTQQTWEEIDVVTFSGSGEPTLALNLGEGIQAVHEYTQCPVVVLTNGTLLGDRAVQEDVATADIVSIKLDAVSSHRWHELNRPASDLLLETVLRNMISFREKYAGFLAIQTMVMEPWPATEEQRYIALLNAIQPDEVQLNTPLRPRPVTHQVDARGNHPIDSDTWRYPRHVTSETLSAMGDRLQAELKAPVKLPPQTPLTSHHIPS
ncbi:MAG: radical SAM protein [Leptolyngbya sp. SIO1D8]|nr:radical SAM protein [Leptolyngbya sp. SIO1D8]